MLELSVFGILLRHLAHTAAHSGVIVLVDVMVANAAAAMRPRADRLPSF